MRSQGFDSHPWLLDPAAFLSSLTIFNYAVEQVEVEVQWLNGQGTQLWVKRSGFKAWQGQCDVFVGKTLTSHRVSLSTQEYKWVLVNFSGKPDEMLWG